MKVFKKVVYAIISLVAAIVIFGLILAYLPAPSRIKNKGITPEEAAVLRQDL